MDLLSELTVTIYTGNLWFLPLVMAFVWWGRDKARALQVLEAVQFLFLLLAILYPILLIWATVRDYNSDPEAGEYSLANRYFGPYAAGVWMQLVTQGVVPHLLWWKSVRALPISALAIWGGQRLAYIMLLVSMTSRDYLPSSWAIWNIPWMTRGWIVYFALVGFIVWWRKRKPRAEEAG